MICPLCQREQVVEVGVTMGPARVTMRSCSGCDARWWDDDQGNRIPFGQVLTFAGQTRRRRRRRVSVEDVLATPPAEVSDGAVAGPSDVETAVTAGDPAPTA